MMQCRRTTRSTRTLLSLQWYLAASKVCRGEHDTPYPSTHRERSTEVAHSPQQDMPTLLFSNGVTLSRQHSIVNQT